METTCNKCHKKMEGSISAIIWFRDRQSNCVFITVKQPLLNIINVQQENTEARDHQVDWAGYCQLLLSYANLDTL